MVANAFSCFNTAGLSIDILDAVEHMLNNFPARQSTFVRGAAYEWGNDKNEYEGSDDFHFAKLIKNCPEIL